jgi:C1A family cysteine protease
MFLCANSWGNSWGAKGYFYLPYKYVTDSTLASDFCTLTIVI